MLIQSSPAPQLQPNPAVSPANSAPQQGGAGGGSRAVPQGLQAATAVPPAPPQLPETPNTSLSQAASLANLGLNPVPPQPSVLSTRSDQAPAQAPVNLEQAQPMQAVRVVSAPKIQLISPEQALSHLKQIHGLEARPNASLIERALVWLKNTLTSTSNLQAKLQQLADVSQQSHSVLSARKELVVNQALFGALSDAKNLDDVSLIMSNGMAAPGLQSPANPTNALASQFLLTSPSAWDTQFQTILQDCNPSVAALLKNAGTSELRAQMDAALPAYFTKNDDGIGILQYQGEQYKGTRKLGEGSFGIAILYKSTTSQATLVLKVPNERVELQQVAEEYQLHHALGSTGPHANMLGLRGLVRGEVRDSKGISKICMITDTAQHGSMNSALNTLSKSDKITDVDKNFLIKKLINDVMQGANRMHETGFVHYDIKPDNLLVNGDGRALIADFGLSKSIKQGEIEKGMRRGTNAFIAPEEHHASEFNTTEKADVWSLGITAYKMMKDGLGLPLGAITAPVVAGIDVLPSRGGPIRSNAAYVAAAEEGSSVDGPAITNAKTPLELLVNRMLATNPADRPSLQEVLNDDVFRILKDASGKISSDTETAAKRLFDQVFSPTPKNTA